MKDKLQNTKTFEVDVYQQGEEMIPVEAVISCCGQNQIKIQNAEYEILITRYKILITKYQII